MKKGKEKRKERRGESVFDEERRKREQCAENS